MNFLSTVLAAALAIAASHGAMAQSPPTQAEQAACRGDGMKFCSSAVGKPAEMNACLRANKAKLSDACKKVVEARGG
jgi:hypothetical protein